MKRILSIFFIALWLPLAAFLSACSFNEAIIESERLNAVMENTNALWAYETKMTAKATADGRQSIQKFSMTVIVGGDEINGSYQVVDGFGYVIDEKHIFLGDYMVKVVGVDSFIDVQKKSMEEFLNAEQVSSALDIDLSKLKFELIETALENNKTKFEIKIKKGDLSNVFDVSGMDADIALKNFRIEIVADDLTDLIDTITVKSDVYYKKDLAGNIEVTMEFLAFNDDVTLIIPDKVYESIKEYRQLHGEFSTVDYNDSEDGNKRYFSIDGFKDAVYDSTSDLIIVIRPSQLDFYSASTMQKVHTIKYSYNIADIDAEDGTLAVALGSFNKIEFYDLLTFEKIREIDTECSAGLVLLYGQTVIYTEFEQWKKIYFVDAAGNKSESLDTYYNATLALNKEDNILYIGQTNLSPSNLFYINATTGENIYSFEHGAFEVVKKPVHFDGTYVHFGGKTFDRFNGNLISVTDLAKAYKGLSSFVFKSTVFENDDISVVTGFRGAKEEAAIYDKNTEKYLTSAYFSADKALKIIGDRFILFDYQNGYILFLEI